MKKFEDLKTVSKTGKMLKELSFMGKPPASFKDDFFTALLYLHYQDRGTSLI